MRSSRPCGCSTCLARSGHSFGDFRRSLPASAATPELRIPCPDGWWLVRASGTESKLTIRCEAQDESGLERLCAAIGDHLRACGLAWGQKAR
ncbi:MAG TPA: hypothetical protein VFN79_09060 [Steroidobacteraceae bacterium]|nr:hypothetical protein [Steroidobacteraceae bacterium]